MIWRLNMMAQPLCLPQPLPMREGGGYSVKDIVFAPIRFCGRQWMWINSDHKDQTSQIALRVLALPFLACATLVSGIIAAVGVRIFSAGHLPERVDFPVPRELALLRRDVSDFDIAGRIRENLNRVECVCSVEVLSMDREVIHNYYPNHIHRYITLQNSSRASRIWEMVKYQFWNKNHPRLNDLYRCTYGDGTPENIAGLKDVLALHKSVTFSMAFDLAYVRTSVVE